MSDTNYNVKVAVSESGTDDVKRKISGLNGEMKSAEGGAEGMAMGLKVAAGAAAVVATAVAAAATVLVNLTQQSIDAADKLQDMSARLNISTERLSVLKVAASLGGSSLEEFTGAAERLSMKMAKQDEDTGKVVSALDQLGVSTKNASGEQKSALQVMEDVIVAADKATDRAEAESLAVLALGKDYYTLRASVLDAKQSKSELYDLMAKTGAIVTGDLAKKSNELNDTVEKSKVVFSGMGNSLAAVAIPMLDKAANAVLGVATAFAEALARITGTEVGSVTASRDLEKLSDQRKKAEEQLAKANPDSPFYQKMQEGVNNLREAEKRLYRQREIAQANEGTAKVTALEGVAGEGPGTASTVSKPAKDKKEKKEKDPAYTYAEIAKLRAADQERMQKEAEEYAKAETDALEKVRKASERYAEQQDRLKDKVLGMADANHQYKKLLEEVNEAFEKGLVTAEKAADARHEIHMRMRDETGTWLDGWKLAFADQQKYATTAAQVGAQSFEAAFGNMETALANFAKTGKLNFADLARSIILDLAMIQMKAAASGLFKMVLGAVGSAFTGGAGGFMNDAGGMELAGSLGFDGGGYTGDSPRSGGLDGKGGFMAMMHPQETVIDHTKGQSMSGGGGMSIGTISIVVQGGTTNEQTAAVIKNEMVATMTKIADGRIANSRRPGGLMYG